MDEEPEAVQITRLGLAALWAMEWRLPVDGHMLADLFREIQVDPHVSPVPETEKGEKALAAVVDAVREFGSRCDARLAGSDWSFVKPDHGAIAELMDALVAFDEAMGWN